MSARPPARFALTAAASWWLAAVAALGIPVPAGASDSTPPMPNAVAETLDKAAATGDPQLVESAMIAAVLRHPDEARAIVQRTLELEPERAEALVKAAKDAFPTLSDAFRDLPESKRKAGTAGGFAEESACSELYSLNSCTGLTDWQGRVSLGGALSTGTSDRQALTGGVKLDDNAGIWTHHLSLEENFARESGDTTQQRFVGEGESDYAFTPRYYGFLFGRYENDSRSGFAWRAIESIGPGYKLVKTALFDLDVKAGPGLRQTAFRESNEIHNEAIGRLTGEATLRLTASSHIDESLELFIGSQRSTIEQKLSFVTPLVSKLDAEIAFEVRHNTQPPSGASPTDTSTTLSLVYRF